MSVTTLPKNPIQIDCEKVQFTGVSAVHIAKKPSISFLVLTHQNPTIVESEFDPVWDGWKGRMPGSRSANRGKIGEENAAATGLSGSLGKGSKCLIAQVRVGSVIMVTAGEAGSGVEMTDTLLERFATVSTQRARQVQEGKTPASTLNDV